MDYFDFIKKEDKDFIFGPLVCSDCSFKFCSEDELKNHLASEHVFTSLFGFIDDLAVKADNNTEPGSQKCDQCDYSTTNTHSLNKHKLVRHEKMVRFKCEFCDMKSYFKNNIQKHMNNSHKDLRGKVVKIQCGKCQFREPHECEMIGGNRVYRKITRKKHNQKRKTQSVTYGMYKCTECNYTSNETTHLRDHTLSLHRDVVNYYCSVCNYKSYYKKCVRRHLPLHKDQGSARIMRVTCRLCLNGDDHQECEESGETLQCDKCDFFSLDQTSLEAHKVSRHERVVRCGECDYTTRTNISLAKHTLTVHRGVVRFQCSLCELKSYYKSNVSRHILSHQDPTGKVLKVAGTEWVENIQYPQLQSEKRFKSDVCDFSTTENVTLENHKLSKHQLQSEKGLKLNCEEGEGHDELIGSVGDIQCPECESVFKSLWQRRKHFLARHPDKTIFQCFHCDYGSNYLTNLQDHVTSSHERRRKKTRPQTRTTCEVCGQKVTSLAKHMRAHQVCTD